MPELRLVQRITASERWNSKGGPDSADAGARHGVHDRTTRPVDPFSNLWFQRRRQIPTGQVVRFGGLEPA